MFAFGIVSLVLLASMPRSQVKAQDQQQGSIVGTWMITSTLTTPPGAPPFVFTELGSFNPGGIFMDTFSLDHNSANPFVPPPLAVDFSEKFGTWKEVRDSNQFAITFKELLFAGPNTPTVYDPILFLGQNVGVATVEAVATLQSGIGGDTITGSFTFQLTNLQQEVVASGSGTFSAIRVGIQPLAMP